MEATESSPQAAAVAAQQVRKFLSKDNYERPHVQYNAIMLIRILADNPGTTFTRNVDKKFVDTVKELLRNGKDPSVQQILRETLQALYSEKAYDTNLSNLFHMWGKESGLGAQRPPPGAAWSQLQQAQQRAWDNQGGHIHTHVTGLPAPAELAARIEEAKTSAKLLQQLVQSTAPGELQNNELVKEFAERCQTAQRSMQGYINAENPSPDDDTMQTLIETSEQLSLAASKHQRALLQARRATGGLRTTPSPRNEPTNGTTVPTLSQPTLPIRNNAPSNLQPSATLVPQLIPTQQIQSTPSGYSPPPVPPPSMRDRFERRTSGQGLPQSPTKGGHSREPSSTNSLYSDDQFPPSPDRPTQGVTPDYDPYRSDSPAGNAPILALPGRGGPPPLQPASRTPNRPLPDLSVPSQPPAAAPVELPSPGYGNPFSDSAHREEDEYFEHDDDDDDPTDTLYRPPGSSARGGSTSMKDRVAAALAAARAGGTQVTPGGKLQPPGRPAAAGQDSWRGQQGSYHPGYRSTPSYVQRQESASEHLTMTGAGSSAENTPTSAGNRGSEAGVSGVSEGYGRVRGSVGDVSPIAERRGGY